MTVEKWCIICGWLQYSKESFVGVVKYVNSWQDFIVNRFYLYFSVLMHLLALAMLPSQQSNRIFKLNRLPRHYHDSSARELVRKLISFVVSCLTTFSSLVPRSPLHGLGMRLYTPEYAYLVQETTGKAERYTWPVMQPFFWKATCVQYHAYITLQFSGWLQAVIAVKVTLADILLLASRTDHGLFTLLMDNKNFAVLISWMAQDLLKTQKYVLHKNWQPYGTSREVCHMDYLSFQSHTKPLKLEYIRRCQVAFWLKHCLTVFVFKMFQMCNVPRLHNICSTWLQHMLISYHHGLTRNSCSVIIFRRRQKVLIGIGPTLTLWGKLQN